MRGGGKKNPPGGPGESEKPFLLQSCRHQSGNFAFGARLGQVVGGLQVEPEFRGGVEGLGEEPGGGGGDASFAVDDFVHALDGNAHMRGKLYLRNFQGKQKFFEENFAGMRGNTIFGLHFLNLMIINQGDVRHIVFLPTKNQSPLVIDADAVVADKVAFEGFEPVAGRRL